MGDILGPVLWGAGISVAAIICAQRSGMAKERSLMAAGLIAIASFYVVFAIQDGPLPGIVFNVFVAVFFGALAVIGFDRSLWVVVAGLIGHGFFDLVYDLSGHSPAPDWWGIFCLVVDVILGVALAVWIVRQDVKSHP